MASTNPFDLLVDDDNDDPIQLLAKLPVAVPTTKKIPVAAKSAANFPSKPAAPAQAVREGKTDGQRGGGRSGGRGAGRGGRGGFNRDSFNDDNSFGNNNGFSGGYRPSENGDADKAVGRGGPRTGNRGGRRGGYTNGDAADGERTRRTYERRSGTGRGNEFKREGAGRGNWGTAADDVAPETEEPVAETEKNVESEKQENGAEVKKENTVEVVEEKEPEVKEMTLEEYEKVLEEKRKALTALKSEERKVGVDKEFASMQLLSNKKNEEDIFVKLGSEKDKRKEVADKDEKAKKSVGIIEELLKPAGRGRGRGRGGFKGDVGATRNKNVAVPSIGDDAQFPSLKVK